MSMMYSFWSWEKGFILKSDRNYSKHKHLYCWSSHSKVLSCTISNSNDVMDNFISISCSCSCPNWSSSNLTNDSSNTPFWSIDWIILIVVSVVVLWNWSYCSSFKRSQIRRPTCRTHIPAAFSSKAVKISSRNDHSRTYDTYSWLCTSSCKCQHTFGCRLGSGP